MKIAVVCLCLVVALTACDLLQGPQWLPGEIGPEGPQGPPGEIMSIEHVIEVGETEYNDATTPPFHAVTIEDARFTSNMWIDVWKESTDGSYVWRLSPHWDEARSLWMFLVMVFDGYITYYDGSTDPAGRVLFIYYAPAEPVS